MQTSDGPSMGFSRPELWGLIALLFAFSSLPTFGQEPLAIRADHGYLLDLPGADDRGYHQKIGFNGSQYFMLLQYSGPAHGCQNPADQIVVWTAGTLFGPWSPRGGSIASARVTPCEVTSPPNIDHTNWGVGSVWRVGDRWYMTVDAGHNGDPHKNFVYLISSPNGIDWESVDPSDLIIDGSSMNQKFLYTTVIETGRAKVGFFFWTGFGDFPTSLGYGQIDLQSSKEPRVHLLDLAGQYVQLPASGVVDFAVLNLQLDLNPRPSDARLTAGLLGEAFGHRVGQARGGVATGGCPADGSDRTNELVTWSFSLTGLDEPRLVLCNHQLCDPVDGSLYNPRNGNPSLIQPDSFTDLDGRDYLVVSAGRDCDTGWWQLTPQLFETNAVSGIDSTPPELISASTTSNSWDIGGSSQVGVTLQARDASGIDEMRVYINRSGSNSANRRGQLSWKHDEYLWPWANEKMPCTGGGYAAKSTGSHSGGEHIALMGCATYVVDDRRTVTFTVRPLPTFGEFSQINDIAGFARDLLGNSGSYQNFDTNFSTFLPPTGPEILFAVTDSGVWQLNQGSHHGVTVRATASQGIDEMRAYINQSGSNSANRRGELSWKHDGYLWPWASEKMPCSGGGYAAKSTTASSGGEHIKLLGCTTHIVGSQRNVTFTVEGRPTFGVFGPINDISASARDLAGQSSSYVHFDSNFSSASVDSTLPVLASADSGGTVWNIGGASQYGVTVRTFDAGGLDEMRAYINRSGSNSANRRGELSWKHDGYLWPWASEKMPCSGGGYAAKSTNASSGGEHITLLGCTTSIVGNQRVVTFSVLPLSSFGVFGPINDIDGYAKDLSGNVRAFTHFNTNFRTTN